MELILEEDLVQLFLKGFGNKIEGLEKKWHYGYKDVNYFRLKIHRHYRLLDSKLAI